MICREISANEKLFSFAEFSFGENTNQYLTCHCIAQYFLTTPLSFLVQCPSGTCSQGTRDGMQKVRQIWQNKGEDSDETWDLREQTDELRDMKFPCARQSSYQSCGRQSVDD